MPQNADLRYAYNLTKKVIKTLEKLDRKLNPFKNKTRRRRLKRKNRTRKN